MHEEVENLKVDRSEITGHTNVWVKDVPVRKRLPPVTILDPNEFHSEHRFVLRLADKSDIYLSDEQAKAIAYAVAKVAAGED